MLHQENKKTKSAFITGGIGDVIALESFMPEDFRQSIETFFYATQKRTKIVELFSALKNYPNLKFHLNVWDDFSEFYDFHSLNEFVLHLQKNKLTCRYSLENCLDLSIMPVYDLIKSKQLAYTGSSFLKESLADIKNFRLPNDFIVIVPHSLQTQILNGRSFTDRDWTQTFNILNSSGMYGVIISGETFEKVPKNDMLVDLRSKTTILQSVEILKLAKGYIGVDSWVASLAAKVFDAHNIRIKSVHEHLYNFAYFYYAPKTQFDFIQRNIDCEKFLQLS